MGVDGRVGMYVDGGGHVVIHLVRVGVDGCVLLRVGASDCGEKDRFHVGVDGGVEMLSCVDEDGHGETERCVDAGDCEEQDPLVALSGEVMQEAKQRMTFVPRSMYNCQPHHF